MRSFIRNFVLITGLSALVLPSTSLGLGTGKTLTSKTSTAISKSTTQKKVSLEYKMKPSLSSAIAGQISQKKIKSVTKDSLYLAINFTDGTTGIMPKTDTVATLFDQDESSLKGFFSHVINSVGASIKTNIKTNGIGTISLKDSFAVGGVQDAYIEQYGSKIFDSLHMSEPVILASVEAMVTEMVVVDIDMMVDGIATAIREIFDMAVVGMTHGQDQFFTFDDSAGSTGNSGVGTTHTDSDGTVHTKLSFGLEAGNPTSGDEYSITQNTDGTQKTTQTDDKDTDDNGYNDTDNDGDGSSDQYDTDDDGDGILDTDEEEDTDTSTDTDTDTSTGSITNESESLLDDFLAQIKCMVDELWYYDDDSSDSDEAFQELVDQYYVGSITADAFKTQFDSLLETVLDKSSLVTITDYNKSTINLTTLKTTLIKVYITK